MTRRLPLSPAMRRTLVVLFKDAYKPVNWHTQESTGASIVTLTRLASRGLIEKVDLPSSPTCWRITALGMTEVGR